MREQENIVANPESESVVLSLIPQTHSVDRLDLYYNSSQKQRLRPMMKTPNNVYILCRFCYTLAMTLLNTALTVHMKR